MVRTLILDGVTFPLREDDPRVSPWETVEQGQRVSAKWQDGFEGGMGSFQREGRSDYLFAHDMDPGTFPYLRLHPAYTSFTLTGLGANQRQPVYTFLEQSADGTDFTYVLNGQYAWKIRHSNGNVDRHDFGAGPTTCGRPAFFKGVWRVPLSIFINARQLDTVANPVDDTDNGTDSWGDMGDKAIHFALLNDPPFVKLARAHTDSKVSVSADASTWGPDFEVGDTGGLFISDLLTASDGLRISRGDGLYHMDAAGNAQRIMDFIGRKTSTKDPDANYDGGLSFQHGPITFWPHSSGLGRFLGVTSFKSIGPDSKPRWMNRTLDSFRVFATAGARWTSVTAFNNFVYATHGSSLFTGTLREDGSVLWHGVIFQDVPRVLRCAIVEGPTQPRLWVFATDQTARRFDLEEDGSFRSGLGTAHGSVSNKGEFWLPIVDGGPELAQKNKQWRYTWAELEGGWGSDGPLQFQAHMDGAAVPVDLGVAVEADGYVERPWTVGTNDRARYIIPKLEVVTTAGYSANDRRIKAMGVEGMTPTVWKAEIDLTTNALADLGLELLDALKKLRDLKDGPAITITPPGEPDLSFSGYVVGLRERMVGDPGQADVGYHMTAFIERYDFGGA